jgi:hypothetical protein
VLVIAYHHALQEEEVVLTEVILLQARFPPPPEAVCTRAATAVKVAAVLRGTQEMVVVAEVAEVVLVDHPALEAEVVVAPGIFTNKPGMFQCHALHAVDLFVRHRRFCLVEAGAEAEYRY